MRRIEMTLSRWGEAMCNGEIQRDEKTGKPFRGRYAIADREAGALKRLEKIVSARNARHPESLVHAYHQTDPRGCTLYVVRVSDLPDTNDDDMRRHSGDWPLKSEATRLQWALECYYTRGLAVCC
jgi:hypothetical protein